MNGFLGKRGSRLVAALAVALPLPAVAADSAWHFNFQQGIAEYAVGSFAEGGSNLALYCTEAGVRPGSVSVTLHRAGFTPAAGTAATFTTERGRVTLFVDREGSVAYPSLAVAPRFRALWQLLATSRTLRVSYGPGRPMVFPLRGAGALLGRTVCPRQLG